MESYSFLLPRCICSMRMKSRRYALMPPTTKKPPNVDNEGHSFHLNKPTNLPLLLRCETYQKPPPSINKPLPPYRSLHLPYTKSPLPYPLTPTLPLLSPLPLNPPSNISNAYTHARAVVLHLPPLRHLHLPVDASTPCILTPASASKYSSARILGCFVPGCAYASPVAAAAHTAYWSSSLCRTARFAGPQVSRKVCGGVGLEGFRGSWKVVWAKYICVASVRIWTEVWSKAGCLRCPVLEEGVVLEGDLRARE